MVARGEPVIRIPSGGAAPELLPAEAVIVILIVDGDAGGDAHVAVLAFGERLAREQIVTPQQEAARGFLGQQATIFQQALVVVGLEQIRVVSARCLVGIGVPCHGRVTKKENGESGHRPDRMAEHPQHRHPLPPTTFGSQLQLPIKV